MDMNYWERPSDEQTSDQIATEDIEFNEDHGIYRAQFDHQTRPPSIAVIEILETALETDIPEIPALYSVLEPDALDRVFEPTLTGKSRDDISIQFTFEGHRFNVHSYGIIEVEPLDAVD